MLYSRPFFSFSSIKSFNSKLSSLIDEIIKKPSSNSISQMQALHSQMTKIEMIKYKKKQNPLYQLQRLEERNRIKDMPTIFQDKKSLYEDFKQNHSYLDQEMKNIEEKKEKERKKNEAKEKKKEKEPKNEKNEKKIILDEKDMEVLQSRQESNIYKNVPPNLSIKTLVFPKTGSEVLLLGVENRNEIHASFVIGTFIIKKTSEKLKRSSQIVKSRCHYQPNISRSPIFHKD
jgi:hypothetical protein